jgi:hypothetical protein
VDRDSLVARLDSEFGGSDSALRAVSRQARDLDDSGRLADDLDTELTVDLICRNLADAPEEYTLIERWNWWIGSLDLSHGGYQRFRVRNDL